MSDTGIEPGTPGPSILCLDHCATEAFSELFAEPLSLILYICVILGTPITYYGEELGLSGEVNETFPWNDISSEYSLEKQKRSLESHYKVYEQLVKARSSPSVLYGELKLQVMKHKKKTLLPINLN